MSQHVTLPAPDFLRRPKSMVQAAYDFIGSPLRMMALPDAVCEKAGMTSLRAERFAMVLPALKGRVLDIGAGYNELIKLYQREYPSQDAQNSIGVDVIEWGAGCTLIQSADKLPFPDASFDTVSYIACINHIPERAASLVEAMRVLKPGGRIVLTMIGRFIGTIGHAIWWYSEDKHRDVDDHEEMGLDKSEMLKLIKDAGYTDIEMQDFCYGLNTLYIAKKPL